MTKLSNLFSYQNTSNKKWGATKDVLKSSINTLLEQRKCNEDVLLLMRDLLEDIRVSTSITDYTEETNYVKK